eukprot:9766825-Heterocapsa_arctica.AAC.1
MGRFGASVADRASLACPAVPAWPSLPGAALGRNAAMGGVVAQASVGLGPASARSDAFARPANNA